MFVVFDFQRFFFFFFLPQDLFSTSMLNSTCTFLTSTDFQVHLVGGLERGGWDLDLNPWFFTKPPIQTTNRREAETSILPHEIPIRLPFSPLLGFPIRFLTSVLVWTLRLCLF